MPVLYVLLGAAAVIAGAVIAASVTYRRLERSTPHPEHPSQWCDGGSYPWERDRG